MCACSSVNYRQFFNKLRDSVCRQFFYKLRDSVCMCACSSVNCRQFFYKLRGRVCMCACSSVITGIDTRHASRHRNSFHWEAFFFPLNKPCAVVLSLSLSHTHTHSLSQEHFALGTLVLHLAPRPLECSGRCDRGDTDTKNNLTKKKT
jgi:hypothetical protein